MTHHHLFSAEECDFESFLFTWLKVNLTTKCQKQQKDLVLTLFSQRQPSFKDLLSPAALALPAINLLPDPTCAVCLPPPSRCRVRGITASGPDPGLILHVCFTFRAPSTALGDEHYS